MTNGLFVVTAFMRSVRQRKCGHYQLPLIATLAFALAGCGESTGTVAGKVTCNGQPVTNGSIAFRIPSKGIAQDGKLEAGGAYTLAMPLPVGTYQVYYVMPTVQPQDPTKNLPPPPEVKSIVPKRFHDVQGSVMVEVKAGQNDIPIEFKD